MAVAVAVVGCMAACSLGRVHAKTGLPQLQGARLEELCGKSGSGGGTEDCAACGASVADEGFEGLHALAQLFHGLGVALVVFLGAALAGLVHRPYAVDDGRDLAEADDKADDDKIVGNVDEGHGSQRGSRVGVGECDAGVSGRVHGKHWFNPLKMRLQECRTG